MKHVTSIILDHSFYGDHWYSYGISLWVFTRGFYYGFLLGDFNNPEINKTITMRLICLLKYVVKSIKLKIIINFWYIYT